MAVPEVFIFTSVNDSGKAKPEVWTGSEFADVQDTGDAELNTAMEAYYLNLLVSEFVIPGMIFRTVPSPFGKIVEVWTGTTWEPLLN